MLCIFLPLCEPLLVGLSPACQAAFQPKSVCGFEINVYNAYTYICLLFTHWPLVTLVTLGVTVAGISPCNQFNLSILPQENVEFTRVLGGRKSCRSCSSLPRRQDTRPDRASRISCRKGWAINRSSWLIDIDRSIGRRDRRTKLKWIYAFMWKIW